MLGHFSHSREKSRNLVKTPSALQALPMKLIVGIMGRVLLTCVMTFSAFATTAQTNRPIAWSEIGANTTAQYSGDGLSVCAGPECTARLRCVFQRLDGEVTREGLRLTSTAPGYANEVFGVTAAAVERSVSRRNPGFDRLSDGYQSEPGNKCALLPKVGEVTLDGQVVQFTRPGLVEEYSVSTDGVRQDFVVLENPTRLSQASCFSVANVERARNRRCEQLRVELAVTGARLEPCPGGAQLVLTQSGRKIAYSRLTVTDAHGKKLPASLEVARVGSSNVEPGALEACPQRLFVIVDDSDAIYPVHIDPTFSDANWISLGGVNGTDGWVFAAVTDTSGNIYIGGSFTVVGNTIANGIAKWDGSTWSALGSGMNNSVYALAVSGNSVYAAGAFTMAGGTAANRIAKWDGSAWSALGSGINNYVYALAVMGSNVYAGGNFNLAGGPANHIAKWDGITWSPLGAGIIGTVYALAVLGNDIYAGSTGSTNAITKWDGSSWSGLGSGIGYTQGYFPVIEALAVSGSDLYVGGRFAIAGGTAAYSIAKWDGTNWSALGSGVSGEVFTLAVSGGDVYVGGGFNTAGGVAANCIAKWNGSTWSALDGGVNNYVAALAVSGSNVYAGGEFTMAGGSPANYIAQWNGGAWSAVASGMNGNVLALATSGSDVYAGGSFSAASGARVNYVAKWTGGAWAALGSQMNFGVRALTLSASDLYAGGGFTIAGGSAANRIAKWDGSAWSALGAGMDKDVYALATLGSDLYAGGSFITAGGSVVNYIAKWDGSSWSALGSGMNTNSSGYSVSALAVMSGDLYAGGYFTMAGGGPANYIAKWDGSSWTPLGAGMNNYVYALAVSGSDLYAGGAFTTAGGIGANYIAKWDGSAWSAVGSGVNNPVTELMVYGNDLYVGGVFTMAGGMAASRIAKWDGSAWTPLGSGMNNGVRALAVSGGYLYAGGDFTTAGGKACGYVARAIAIPGDWLHLTRGVPGPNINTLSFVGVPAQSYTIQFATNLDAPLWQSLATTNADTNGISVVQDPGPSTASRFYRVTSP